MSLYTSELCVLLVHDAYGELASRIFEALLRHGRSTVPALQNDTRFSFRQLKYGLSALVQQNLVFWCQTWEDDQAIFDANVSAAYNLARIGKYVNIAESRVGASAGTIISHLLLLGHARVEDIVRTLNHSDDSNMNGYVATASTLPGEAMLGDTHTNGETNGNSSTAQEKINSTLGKLLQFGLILPAHEPILRSDADNHIEANKMCAKLRDKKTKSEKAKDEIQAAQVKTLLHQWTFGTRKKRSEIRALKMAPKRKIEDSEDSPAGKRQRIGSSASKYAVPSAEWDSAPLTLNNLLNNDLVIRINHHKFMVMMRSDHLVCLAEKAIGIVTSQIYLEVLRQIEINTLACTEESYEDEADDDGKEILSQPPTITTHQVATSLIEDPKYANSLGKIDPKVSRDASFHPKNHRKKPNGLHESAVANGEASAEDNNDSDSSGDESDDSSVVDVSPSQEMADDFYDLNDDYTQHHLIIRQHLLLLSHHPDHFLVHIHATPVTPERWTIDFGDIRKKAILKEIFQTIDTRLGILSTRLARICHEYGRVDDKSLQTKSLLAQKEMRARLGQMQKSGLLGLQEVPRDNTRLASRTSFLYYMDEKVAAAKIMDECYKTMARCIQRLGVEREKVAGVLEKAERSDVKGKEDSMLGVPEREALTRWKVQEEMIWGEIGRVDDVVAVLRDF